MLLSSALAMTLNAYMSLAFLTAMDEFPKQSVIGNTYPIAEGDALAEIEEKAERTPFDPAAFGKPNEWSAADSALVPPGSQPRVRFVTPFHQLAFGVPDQNGDILYPAGFTFNPLEHATIPGRIIVTLPDRIEWALSEARPMDMVLVSGATPEQVLGRPGQSIFLLSDILAERLDIKTAPTVIRQVGSQLELTELTAAEVPVDGSDDDTSAPHTPASGKVGLQ
jgi:conjugal transfer pilus assembly protein TraW